MNLNLDDLEAVARAATPSEGEWNTSEPASVGWRSNRANNAAYCRAFNPSTALALISALRTAREALEYYAKGRHLFGEAEFSPANVCPPIGFHAQEALAKLDEVGK